MRRQQCKTPIPPCRAGRASSSLHQLDDLTRDRGTRWTSRIVEAGVTRQRDALGYDLDARIALGAALVRHTSIRRVCDTVEVARGTPCKTDCLTPAGRLRII